MVDRLEQQRLEYQSKENRRKEHKAAVKARLLQEHETHQNHACVVTSMEKRAQYFSNRRAARVLAMREKHQLEVCKKHKQESDHFNRLVASTVPTSHTTKAQESRVKMVRPLGGQISVTYLSSFLHIIAPHITACTVTTYTSRHTIILPCVLFLR